MQSSSTKQVSVRRTTVLSFTFSNYTLAYDCTIGGGNRQKVNLTNA